MNTLTIIFIIICVTIIAISTNAVIYSKTINGHITDYDHFTKKQSLKHKLYERYVLTSATTLSKHIKINKQYESYIARKLVSANNETEPKIFISIVIIKLLFVFGFGCLFGSFILALDLPSPIILTFNTLILLILIFLYRDEINKLDNKTIAIRNDVEKELPRFVDSLKEMLKQKDSNIIYFFNSFSKSTNENFKKELQTTAKDMELGNYELALVKLDNKLNSPKLTEVIKGLINTLRGDDTIYYFNSLSNTFKQEELTKLRLQAKLQPQKIVKYSWANVGVFVVILTYIAMKLLSSTLNSLFS